MPPFFDPTRFIIESAFAALTILFCGFIYYRTRELEELTKYAGIRRFRKAFLYFGLAYLARFLLHLLMVATFSLGVRPRVLELPVLAVIGYLSTIALLYLVYSAVGKRLTIPRFSFWSNLIALSLSLLSVLTHSHHLLIFLQAGLFVVAAALMLLRKPTHHSEVRFLYGLMLLFWLINLYLIGPRRFLPLEFMLLLQAASLAVFLLIVRKVNKWVR